MEASIGLYRNDCEIILSHLKHHEKQLKLKRRWLMGKPIPKSKEKHLNFRSIPESLLREDDMFFATVTQHVEEAFGAKEKDNILEEMKDLLDNSNLKGIILSCLNALSNKGLFRLAMLLTRGSIDYGIPRPKLKKEIRKLIRNKHCKIQVEMFAQLCELLKDPQNVRDNCLASLIPKFNPHYVSAAKILDRLEELPNDALFAMLRKLRGTPAGTLGLEHKRYGRSRTELICSIRRICKKLLLKLGRGDILEGPLANALVAASLLLKLSPDNSTFNHISPEVRMLQSEIAKALQQLNVKGKVRFSKLEAFKLLVDPDAKVQNACLRTAIKKMLIAYLFECSNMDVIPKFFVKALAVINSGSPSMPSGCFSKDEKAEDVECILNLSAQMKQIVSGFLPDHDFDEDFTDAYMEELEESEEEDDNYVQTSTSTSCSLESDLQESFGEFLPVDSEEVESPQKLGPSNLAPVQSLNVPEGSAAVDPESPGDIVFSNLFSEGEKNVANEQSTRVNTYLGIQEKCDETSVVAYDLIGQIMERFAQEEGIYLEPVASSYLQGKCHLEDRDEVMTCGENVEGSVVVQVVENLLPSLPKSTMEKLKELML